jgi:hypothetical protein
MVNETLIQFIVFYHHILPGDLEEKKARNSRALCFDIITCNIFEASLTFKTLYCLSLHSLWSQLITQKTPRDRTKHYILLSACMHEKMLQRALPKVSIESHRIETTRQPYLPTTFFFSASTISILASPSLGLPQRKLGLSRFARRYQQE